MTEASKVAQTAWIRSLRAVRSFSDKPIPDDVLLDILDTGRWTGSAKNTQPWDLIVVRDREKLGLLSKCGPFGWHLAGAPLGVGLIMHGKDLWSGMDEGRLMQNLMLGAWAHGIGSCIASIYPDENEQRARDLLLIPNNLHLRTILSMGYPRGPEALRLPASSPLPRGRRPMNELVSWEQFGTRANP
jgi:nitroreductase